MSENGVVLIIDPNTVRVKLSIRKNGTVDIEQEPQGAMTNLGLATVLVQIAGTLLKPESENEARRILEQAARAMQGRDLGHG